MDSVRIKRGLKANLPKELPLGELAFCTDTREVYVGMGKGTPPRPMTNTEITNHLSTWENKYQTKYDAESNRFQTKYEGLETEYATELTEVKNKNEQLTSQLDNKANLTDLGNRVKGQSNKSVVTCAGVIRNKGEGWFYIEDAVHNNINFTAISVNASGSIVVRHTPTAKKVGTLIATPDETFGREGLIIGASVGYVESYLDLLFPLNVQIKGDGTFTTNPYFSDTTVDISTDKSTITVNHAECTDLDTPTVIAPITNGEGAEYRVSYSKNNTTIRLMQDLSGYIYYDTATNTFKYIGNNVDDFVFDFNTTTGILTVTHGKINLYNAYSMFAIERDGGFTPKVVSTLDASFTIKFYNVGDLVTTPDSKCKFYFGRPAKYKSKIASGNKICLKRGHCKVNANNVISLSGNIWLHGLMQE